jgi:molybdopterin synthase sulfur carrier subunit
VIHILFFARLREQLGCSDMEIEWQESLATVASLKQYLQAQQQGWDDVLSADNILCAVNQEQAEDQQPVADGDEVAFFPPVTGG